MAIDVAKTSLNAINVGLIRDYNQLLKEHFAVYQELKLQPCQSSFFPSGCEVKKQNDSSTKETKVKVTSCFPVGAKDAKEVIHIEQGSTHDGCYTRDSHGNLFFNGTTGPSNYKRLFADFASNTMPSKGDISQPPPLSVGDHASPYPSDQLGPPKSLCYAPQAQCNDKCKAYGFTSDAEACYSECRKMWKKCCADHERMFPYAEWGCG